jgi:hypothetical protein
VPRFPLPLNYLYSPQIRDLVPTGFSGAARESGREALIIYYVDRTELACRFAMEISAENAGEWLSRNGIPAAAGNFTELGGGVSNNVILAEIPRFAEAPPLRLIIKQSLGRLRVESEWLSDRERIFREAAAMRWLDGRVRGGRIPRVRLEDRGEFAIAMESAPEGAEMWKARLFRGDLDSDTARAAGTLLGSIVSASWNNADARSAFGDQTVFDQLRIDPYYRFTARRHPERAGYFHDLIDRSSHRRVCIVHGDWSPKNLLVAASELWAIDWEVIHFGDPSFDAGFLLNHLLLKSIAMPEHSEGFAALARTFYDALSAELPRGAQWIPEAALEHVPALLLARVDGKSPAEYLNAEMAERARNIAVSLMRDSAGSPEKLFTR